MRAAAFLLALASAIPAQTLVITKGGTYSGTYASADPKTPAISVRTDAPVIIQNSTLRSVGDLINIKGRTAANVTIQNVTATSLPAPLNKERGAFVTGTNLGSLVVRNNTVTGASFGVAAYYSTVTTLQVSNNSFAALEDRASDGKGGFKARIPAFGHMVILDHIIAPNGADIGWNQLVGTIGANSTQDGINLYKSAGTLAHPIRVHDNYLEGMWSFGQYSGSGIITDGDPALPVTAYTVFEANQIVHTAGSGIALANGHDQQVLNNRVVSCGQANGAWYAQSFVNAVLVTNYYDAPQFTSHTVTGTTGGMLRPGASGQAIPVNLWTDSATDLLSAAANGFTNPCLRAGYDAEGAERAYWKVKSAGQAVGDHHLN